MQYDFEWDLVKTKSNLKRHSVSFEEASEIFLAPLQLSMPDNVYSEQKERWVSLGYTKEHQLRIGNAYLYHLSSSSATRHKPTQYQAS